MKKLLKILLPIVISAALGTTGIFVFKDNTEYYVDAKAFESTVEYMGDVDLSGLTIVETKKDEIVATHQVDESMVVSCDSTSSIGEKELILSFEKNQFIVNFIVMYKATFMVGENVLTEKFVNKASEIDVPKDPYKFGFEFTGWTPSIPNVINDNITFEATFTDTPQEIPNLGVFSATYGDTLESVVLPSNAYGKWTFVDDLSTTVGNAGLNKFDVKFVPTNSELKEIKDTIEISVSKKVLEFKNVVTNFTYDGLEHLPTYELDAEDVNVVTIGTPGVEAGTYFVIFTINDDNYEGQWQGNFTIASAEIVISFDLTDESIAQELKDALYVIDLGDSLPEFKYSVTGIESPDLLQLSLSTPKVNHAGDYEITVSVGNTSYKDVTVSNKCLNARVRR